MGEYSTVTVPKAFHNYKGDYFHCTLLELAFGASVRFLMVGLSAQRYTVVLGKPG